MYFVNFSNSFNSTANIFGVSLSQTLKQKYVFFLVEYWNEIKDDNKKKNEWSFY